jgi:hypothetical protein
MKKLLALILCLLFFAVPLSAYAESETEETVTDQGETLPEQEEAAPEAAGPALVPETTEGSEWEEIKETISGAFVKWVEPNIEEIGVVVTLIGYGIVLFKKLANVLKSLGIMNNNTITISKENANIMEQALTAVTGYEERIKVLLEHYTNLAETLMQTAEDKKKLENELIEIKNYLKISADANLEFSNEFAELLGLANIPNYVKEEIGARHVAAKNNIIEAEKKAVALLVAPEEVKEDAGEEKKD